jgi:hypothetical protein
MNADESLLIYSSPNGDVWLLCHEDKSGRAFVKHRANAAAGANEIDMEVADFISQGPVNPEHEALFRLMADGAVTTAERMPHDRLSGSGNTSAQKGVTERAPRRRT